MVIDAPGALDGKEGIPESPYRRLIDATEQDVALVMVGGNPQAGDVNVMQAVKPGDFELIASDAGCFEKAIDVTAPLLPAGTETLAQVTTVIGDALRALGGDHPPAGGGPSSPFANTWSYLKARFPGGSALPDIIFNFALAQFAGMTADGKINLEAIALPPLFTADDHWWFATLEGERDPSTGLTADDASPYAAYPSNANQVNASGNVFARAAFHDRWYGSSCTIH
jgi:hypothetical protein